MKNRGLRFKNRGLPNRFLAKNRGLIGPILSLVVLYKKKSVVEFAFFVKICIALFYVIMTFTKLKKKSSCGFSQSHQKNSYH